MRQKRGTRNIPLIQQVLEASILNKCSHSSSWRGRQESTKHVSTPAWWQTKQLQPGMYYTCMYASFTQPKLSALLEHCLLSKLPLAPDLEGFNSKRCTEISTWQWSKSHYSILLSSNYSWQLKSCHQCGSQRSTCISPAMYNADTQPLALQTQCNKWLRPQCFAPATLSMNPGSGFEARQGRRVTITYIGFRPHRWGRGARGEACDELQLVHLIMANFRK